MLKLIFLWLSLFVVTTQARPLSLVENQLYESILSSQIQSHKYSSYVGSWPTYARWAHLVDFSMTSSFESVQILLFLNQIERFASLTSMERLAQVRHLSFHQLKNYINEAALTGEPAGSVNFYPFLDPLRQTRGFPSLPRDLAFKILGYPLSEANIPNDWDCGARTYVLTHSQPEMAHWTSQFPIHVGEWVDRGNSPRFEPNPWKIKNSGAFLTWAEPDQIQNPNSRIIDGLNDVDCVVNLNILEALGVAEKIQALPDATATAKEASCRLINSMIKEGPSGGIQRCGVYYSRPTQVLLSYARASESLGLNKASNCLQSSYNQAVQSSLVFSKNLVRKGKSSPLVELGEVLIALKTLVSPEQRTLEVQKQIDNLTQIILSRIKHEPRSGDEFNPMYSYRYRGWNLQFWSPAYTSSLLLYSLVRP